MAKLCQIIAIEKGIKGKTHSIMSELYKQVQKPELFNGFTKQYRKKDDDGEDFPQESKRVVLDAGEVILGAKKALGELFEITARKEWANCQASADIKVDGKVVLQHVPVTYLLFLEKQITDLRTFLAALPVLSADDEWDQDQNGLFRSHPVETHKTKKVQKGLVLYGATDKHPAQCQMITDDVVVGYWTTVKLSGAISKVAKEAVLEKCEQLLLAVKQAREEANTLEEGAAVPKVADSLLSYIFSAN